MVGGGFWEMVVLFTVLKCEQMKFSFFAFAYFLVIKK